MMNPVMADLIFIIVVMAALALGLFIFLCPMKVFEIQKNFYAAINWKIEPISMEKEIRNTRIMGLVLIVFVGLACGYAFGYD